MVPGPQDVSSPLPALVTVGAGDADVLVDLEAYGVVALVGDEHAYQDMTRAMVAELSARAEGTVAVEMVGGPIDATVLLDGVDYHEACDEVETGIVGTSARLLDTGGWPHTWAARASGRIYDGWVSTVWLTAATDERRHLDALDAIATRPGAGSAMVGVGDDPGCGLRIHLDGHGRFHIPQLGLQGEAQTPRRGRCRRCRAAGCAGPRCGCRRPGHRCRARRGRTRGPPREP